MSSASESNDTTLDALWALQEEDSVANALAHRRANLAERAELAAVERELVVLAARRATLDVEMGGHEARLDELGQEVSQIVERAARIDDRLRGSEAGSFRDQEAMATEMGQLDQHRRALDDEQLVIMEAIEPLEGELARLDDEQRRLTERAASIKQALAAAEQVIDAELSESRTRRAALAAAVPVALLSEYERLRARLGGVAVARLVGSACSGCHLALSAAQLDHFRHRKPDEVIYCDQCGRILVA